jgi:predicted patatin/cPLA2 family phospholipase
MRSIVYNQQLDLVERLEDEGRIVVIRPQKPVEVDRIERDTRKLSALYEEGYEIASQLSISPS